MEKHDLSYRVDGDTSLVAPLLKQYNLATVEWRESGIDERVVDCTFEFTAEPGGLLPWLICRFNRYIAGSPYSNYVQLERKEHGVKAQVAMFSRTLRLRVVGPYPIELFATLRRDVDHLMRERWPFIQWDSYISCQGKLGSTECEGRFRHSALVRAAALGNTSVQCGECLAMKNIDHLLGGFGGTGRTGPSDEFARVMRRIDKLQASSTQVQNLVRTQSQVQSQLRADAAQIVETVKSVREMMLLGNADTPSLFIIRPADRARWNPRRLVDAKYQLILWCEHEDAPHAVEPPYEFSQSRQWFIKYRSAIVFMSRLARLLPVVGAVADTDAVQDMLSDGSLLGDLDLMASVGEAAFDLVDDRQLPSRQMSADEVMRRGSEADYRVVGELLKDLDPYKVFAGLSPVVTVPGNVVWVCNRHRAYYDPGLPSV